VLNSVVVLFDLYTIKSVIEPFGGVYSVYMYLCD